MPAIFRPLSLLLIILAAISNSHAQENQAPGDVSGKLYVLDAGNNRKKPQVLVVDPSNGKAIRTYRAGFQPDMTLSPDGKLLYISSFENAASGLENFLDIYDTASGALLNHISNPEALQHKIPVYGTSMVMSPDGKRIYIEKYHWVPERPGPTGCYTSVFDTESRRFLVNISVSSCGVAVLPANEELTFYLISTAKAAIDTFTIPGREGRVNAAHHYTSISI
ncbi:MAG TPA: amine dehydrogenase large subunit, partial [Candidatus Angelobacter sp.]|nr:amine dehydrogenase large subunit [Candidatus Angelobacter sp.]